MALRFPNIQEDLRLRVSRMTSIVSVSEADSDICTLNQRVLVGFRSVWVSNILFPKCRDLPGLSCGVTEQLRRGQAILAAVNLPVL